MDSTASATAVDSPSVPWCAVGSSNEDVYVEPEDGDLDVAAADVGADGDVDVDVDGADAVVDIHGYVHERARVEKKNGHTEGYGVCDVVSAAGTGSCDWVVVRVMYVTTRMIVVFCMSMIFLIPV